jgi:hypothetical protein
LKMEAVRVSKICLFVSDYTVSHSEDIVIRIYQMLLETQILLARILLTAVK